MKVLIVIHLERLTKVLQAVEEWGTNMRNTFSLSYILFPKKPEIYTVRA